MVSILPCYNNYSALKELPFLNLGGNKINLPSRAHDSVSDMITIPRGFPFGNSVHNTVYVRINLLCDIDSAVSVLYIT